MKDTALQALRVRIGWIVKMVVGRARPRSTSAGSEHSNAHPDFHGLSGFMVLICQLTGVDLPSNVGIHVFLMEENSVLISCSHIYLVELLLAEKTSDWG